MTKPPYDPDKLPPDLRKLIPNYPDMSTTFEYQNVVTPQRQTKSVLPKSSAQGGSSVRTASGLNSRELKLQTKKIIELPSTSPLKRSPRLELKLSETQKEIVKERASQLGMTMTQYGKTMLLDESYDPAVRDALLRLYRQLSGIATNINQATAKLHREGDHAGYMAVLKELCRPLLDTIYEVRAALANSTRGIAP